LKLVHAAFMAIVVGSFFVSHPRIVEASSAEIQSAEQQFWTAAKRTENSGIISAYLLHFSDGRFVDSATKLFQKKTGQAWTPKVADHTAWHDPANDSLSSLSDGALSGRWEHEASCDVNFFVQDVDAASQQVFRVSAPGILKGESTFSSGNSFKGAGEILELRRDRSVVTYVMVAQNSLTGSEIHIGILNLRQSNGQLLTRGWEMNTGGAYCDLNGRKIQ